MSGDRDLEKTSLHDSGEPVEAPSGSLLLVAGDGQLRTFTLVGDQAVIGRAADCDVVIDHRALSRRHATVRRRPALSVQDLGSTNGTRVTRGMLHGGEQVGLTPGESFHIGPFSFVVVSARAGAVPPRTSSSDRFVVEDPTVGAVSSFVRDVANSGVNVLVLGETGVGKEVLASTIHALSSRAGPLSRINCAALAESLLESELFGHERGAFTGAVTSKAGLLEVAAGGTVFLDEIGELPLPLQAKLLRAVEGREILRLGSTRPISIDVRFVAATNRDLATEVANGRFRHDLYFRLDGMSLHIPPLRERSAAIPALALQFLEEAARRLGRTAARATPAFLTALEAHDWPGNVRELKAVIERAMLLVGDRALGVEHLAFSPRPPTKPQPVTGELSFLTDEQRAERDRMLAALDDCAGNQTRAAKQLGISRATLTHKLALYRIPRPRA